MRKSRLIYFLLFLYIIPVVVYSLMGTYSRPLSDDFCDAERALSKGIIPGSIGLYFSYEGRFTANLIQTVIGSTKFSVIPYLPMLYCIMFCLGLFFTFSQISKQLTSNKLPYLSLLLTLAILGGYLSIIPNVNQSFYWANAAVDYFLPTVILTFLLLDISMWMDKRQKQERLRISGNHIVGFLLTIIIGGLNEVAVTVELVCFALLIINLVIFYKKEDKKDLLLFATVCLLGSLLAFFLVLLAPGNEIRKATNPQSPGFFGLVVISLRSFIKFFSNLYTYPSKMLNLIALAIMFGISGLYISSKNPIHKVNKSSVWLYILLIPINALIIIFASFFPGAYGLSASLPTRALSIPTFVLILSTALIGFLIGRLHSNKAIMDVDHKILTAFLIIAILFLSSVPIFNSYRAWRDGESLRIYSMQWDKSEKIITTAVQNGEETIVIEKLIDWSNRNNLSSDKMNWVNRCASAVYGINILTQ